jgi:hypothetical protein
VEEREKSNVWRYTERFSAVDEEEKEEKRKRRKGPNAKPKT